MTMMSYWFAIVLIPLRVLRDAVTEGPVFLFDFNQVDEYILRAEARVFAQPLDDPLEECLLLLNRPRVADGQLDDDEIVASLDAKIVRTVEEVAVLVLADGDEEVVLGNVEGLTQ